MNLFFKNKTYSSASGNAILGIIILSAVCSLAGYFIASVGSIYYQAAQDATKAGSALTENTFNLSLMAEKFKFINSEKPVWYPVPYPTKEEMLQNTVRPTVKVLKLAAESAVPMVKTSIEYKEGEELKQQALVLDITRMASLTSLEELEKDPNLIQQGFFASGSIQNLDQDQASGFFSSPSSGWPTAEGGGSSLAKIGEYSFHFVKYIADENSPDAIKQIQVSVEAEKAGKKVVTLANISVDAPPAPECALVLKENQTLPAKPKDKLKFIIKSDSITSYARVSADNEVTYNSIPVISHQSIENLGSFVPVTSEIELVVPDIASPTESGLAPPSWTVYASVSGPLSSLGSNFCQVEVPLALAPKPDCTLTAMPSNVTKGETTRLLLSCKNEVTSADIGGVPVVLRAPPTPPPDPNAARLAAAQKRRLEQLNRLGINLGNQEKLPEIVQPPKTASLNYVKTKYEAETVTATVVGPGGTSTPSVAIGDTCRFNNPDYIQLTGITWGDNAKGMTGNREISHGPLREYWYTGTAVNTYVVRGAGLIRRVYQASNLYQYRGTEQFGGVGIKASDCQNSSSGTQSLCMYSGSCPGGDCWHPSGLVLMQFGPKDSPSCALERVYVRRPFDGCFSEDTKVLAYPKREIRVSDVREGQLLWNPVLGKPVKVTRVTAGPEKNALWEVKTSHSQVHVTFDHPFLTERGMQQARHLAVGDKLLLAGKTEKVVAVRKVSSEKGKKVWNFELEGESEREHFVLANGLPAGDHILQRELKKNLLP